MTFLSFLEVAGYGRPATIPCDTDAPCVNAA